MLTGLFRKVKIEYDGIYAIETGKNSINIFIKERN
jgi:hypothetical protein